VKFSRGSTVGPGSAPSGSSSTSGAPASTCTLVPASRWRIRPANGADTERSIFMLSSTATASPAATTSPTATGTATITPGLGARTTPPSRRRRRWGTPSTSTRWSPPWLAETTDSDRDPSSTRLWNGPSRVTVSSTCTPSTSTS
jgi:hypothetical protein